MPYIIAVLLLVILGTGYTLFQKQEVTQEISASPNKEISLASSTPPATVNSEDVFDDKDDDHEKNDEIDDVDDNPSASDLVEATKPLPTPVATTPTPAPADNNTYTNGTYRTQTSYRTPDGTYQMEVSLTIAHDTITATSLSFDADGAKDGYSKRFSNGYQSSIIGQDLGSANLSRVGGASLTTKAFNKAIDNIEAQATS